jgi:arylsulfatase A-like enzyme
MEAYRQLGFGAQSAGSFSGDVHPPELLPETLELIHDPMALSASDALRFANLNEKQLRDWQSSSEYSRSDRYSILKFEHASDLTNLAIADALLQDVSWDAFFLYLPGLDGFQHHFYQFRFPEEFDQVDPVELRKYSGSINAYYKFLDQVLGSFLNKLPEDCILLICSDHGIEANQDYSPDEGRAYNQYASGIHTITAPGAFILRAPMVKSDFQCEQSSVLDLTPTLLALMGFPAGQDMAGRVLLETVDSSWRAGHQVERIPTYDAGYSPDVDEDLAGRQDPELLERLKALGYIN